MITLNLVEYKRGEWGFVGHIPVEFRVLREDESGEKIVDTVYFPTETDAVAAALKAGYDVRIYRQKVRKIS